MSSEPAHLAATSPGETVQTGRTTMSTIHGTTELGPASAKRQVYSPLETYWNAFQEWRKRRRLQTTLCDLNDRELHDIGIARGEIDYVASNRSIDPRGMPPIDV
jgi:uncharacterized protein YjiS (DUF1127 family)